MREAELGDERRRTRVARMLARAAERPGGRVTDVFSDAAERQGAYDLLEAGRVQPRTLVVSFARAAFERTASPWVYAVVDGSSIHVTDLTHDKGLGSLGSLSNGARGMKVISALGVEPTGVTLGLLGQVWWARTDAKRHSADKRKRNAARPLSEKETRHWLDAIEQAQVGADAAGKRLWFQLDREGDNQDILHGLVATEHEWTVRAAWDRLTEATGRDEQRLRQMLSERPAIGAYEFEVTGRANRKARTARMVTRTASVTLMLRRRGSHKATRLEVNVVWTREEGTTPAGEEPIDWLLLTNHSVDTYENAREVVAGYVYRWRIEEFHRAWKSGGCRVEQTQLRSAQAVSVWATMLAAAAARGERLRLLSRHQPELPASAELSEHEIRAIILLKRNIRARNESIPNTMPTLGTAVRWIADIGGYTGKSSGGPPGAITIRRGLERISGGADVLAALASAASGSDQC